jgi:hypothetical protein
MAKKKASSETLPAKIEEPMLPAVLMEDAPSFITDDTDLDKNAGRENMSADDMLVPRLLIMQPLTPRVADGDGEVKPGEIWLSSLDIQLIDKGEECFFIPVFHYKEWIKWGDRDANEGMLDRSTDPQGELAMSAHRREKRETPKGPVNVVTQYHNFIVVFPHLGLEKPFLISCGKSNHRHGQELLALSAYRGERPLCAGKYSVAAKQEANRKGEKYQAFDFKNAGWADQPEFEAAKIMYKRAKEAHEAQQLKGDLETQEPSGPARGSNETEM